MSEGNKEFWDMPTVLAVIAIIVGIPYFLIATVFNPKIRLSDRIICYLATLPSLLSAIFYGAIMIAFPIVLMVVSLQSDAWPLGLMIAFYLSLVVIQAIKRIFS